MSDCGGILDEILPALLLLWNSALALEFHLCLRFRFARKILLCS